MRWNGAAVADRALSIAIVTKKWNTNHIYMQTPFKWHSGFIVVKMSFSRLSAWKLLLASSMASFMHNIIFSYINCRHVDKIEHAKSVGPFSLSLAPSLLLALEPLEIPALPPSRHLSVH